MDINIPSQIKLFANLSSFPLTGEVKTLYIDKATANHYYWSGSAYVQLKDGTKFPTPTGTTSQYLRGDGSLATFPSIPDPANFVAKADYTPSHSVLVQQSGTGSPTPVQIGNNEFLGRKTGGGSNIEGLSVSEVKSILNYTASDVGAPSGSGTSTGTNTGDETQSSILAKLGWWKIQDTTGGTTSSGTSNTISKSIALPFVPQFLKFRVTGFRNSGSTNTFTIRAYLSEVDNNIGGTAILIATVTGGNSAVSYLPLVRNNLKIVSGNIIGLTNTGPQVTDDVNNSSARQNQAIPTGTPLYLILAIQCANASDTAIIESVEISNF
jgi:hypothetical protein